MRVLPAAPCTRRMNWRSVAFRAVSGMLLIRAMVSPAAPSRPRSPSIGTSAGLRIGRCLSNGSDMGRSRLLFGGLQRRQPARLGERLVDVLDDVLDMLDTDREADGFRQNAGHALLLRRHLAVRGGGRMAGKRFGVADIDESRDQLQ